MTKPALFIFLLLACSTQKKPAATLLPSPSPAAAPTSVPPSPPTIGYTPGPVTAGGSIRGHVTFTGKPPKLPPVRCARDPDICGMKPRPNQALQVSAQGGLKDVIVSLTDIHAGKPAPPVDAALEIKRCAYTPRVQAVPVGSNLTITNLDQVPHDLAGTLVDRALFNRVVLRKPEKVALFTAGPLNLGCDTHGGTAKSVGCETGVIGVMPHPYFAVTGADGAFALTDIPAGTYMLQAWHETLGAQSHHVTVAENGSASVDLRFASKGN